MSRQHVILYPADYFDHGIADDMFERERMIAEKHGMVTALFDFDTFEIVHADKNATDAEEAVVIYRGWQVPVDTYEHELLPLMRQFGKPLTSPAEYAHMHAADNYIEDVGNLMLPSMVLRYDEVMSRPETLWDVAEALGEHIFVKDGIKSVHGHVSIRLEREDVRALEHAMSELETIRKSRGDAFAGTFVLKPFVDIFEQSRAFVIDGKIALAVPHDAYWSGHVPSNAPTDLPSPFYTVDMGHDAETGEWFVVECGDGQVSDVGGSVEDITQLYAVLERM